MIIPYDIHCATVDRSSVTQPHVVHTRYTTSTNTNTNTILYSIHLLLKGSGIGRLCGTRDIIN